jgi:hypothetical protein
MKEREISQHRIFLNIVQIVNFETRSDERYCKSIAIRLAKVERDDGLGGAEAMVTILNRLRYAVPCFLQGFIVLSVFDIKAAERQWR